METQQLMNVSTGLQKVTEVGTPVIGVGTMVMNYFDTHAAGIGAICTVISLVTYVGISLYKVVKDYRRHK